MHLSLGAITDETGETKYRCTILGILTWDVCFPNSFRLRLFRYDSANKRSFDRCQSLMTLTPLSFSGQSVLVKQLNSDVLPHFCCKNMEIHMKDKINFPSKKPGLYKIL